MKLIINKFLILPIGILIVLCHSCRPDPLEIQIDPVASEVVIFSQVIPQLVTTIVLTNTISALEFSDENGDSLNNDILDQLLEDSASVTISYLDEIDTLVENAAGVYTGLFIPRYINEVYKLDVTTVEGKKIHAESKMLPTVPFNEIMPMIERTNEDTLVKIAYHISDPNESNWYVINVYTNNSEGRDTNGVNLDGFFGGQSSFLAGTRLLDDQIFKSTDFYDTLLLETLTPTDSIVISIANISEVYYNYLKLRKTSNNIFTEITKEPINYPTNIDNGLGFFNTHFPDLKYFDLTKY